jgi:hypothetical protein
MTERQPRPTDRFVSRDEDLTIYDEKGRVVRDRGRKVRWWQRRRVEKRIRREETKQLAKGLGTTERAAERIIANSDASRTRPDGKIIDA